MGETIHEKAAIAAQESFRKTMLLLLKTGNIEDAKTLLQKTVENSRKEGEDTKAEAYIQWAQEQGVELDEIAQ